MPEWTRVRFVDTKGPAVALNAHSEKPDLNVPEDYKADHPDEHPTDWGWHGLYMQADDDAIGQLMPRAVYTAQLPVGWDVWRGWEKHLMKG